jgi:MFS family permease
MCSYDLCTVIFCTDKVRTVVQTFFGVVFTLGGAIMVIITGSVVIYWVNNNTYWCPNLFVGCMLFAATALFITGGALLGKVLIEDDRADKLATMDLNEETYVRCWLITQLTFVSLGMLFLLAGAGVASAAGGLTADYTPPHNSTCTVSGTSSALFGIAGTAFAIALAAILSLVIGIIKIIQLASGYQYIPLTQQPQVQIAAANANPTAKELRLEKAKLMNLNYPTITKWV